MRAARWTAERVIGHAAALVGLIPAAAPLAAVDAHQAVCSSGPGG
jgi:hypothetical protein